MALAPSPNTVIPCSFSSQSSTALPIQINSVLANGVDAIGISSSTAAFTIGNVITVTLNPSAQFNLMITLNNTAHVVSLYKNNTFVSTVTNTLLMTSLGSVNPTTTDVYTLRIYIGAAVAINTLIATINCQKIPTFTSFVQETDFSAQIQSMITSGQVSYTLDTNGQYILTFTNAQLTADIFDPLYYFPLLALYNTLISGTLTVVPQGMISSYINNTTMAFNGNQNIMAAMQWNGIAFPQSGGVSGVITVGIVGVGIPVITPLVPYQFFNNISPDPVNNGVSAASARTFTPQLPSQFNVAAASAAPVLSRQVSTLLIAPATEPSSTAPAQSASSKFSRLLNTTSTIVE